VRFEVSPAVGFEDHCLLACNTVQSGGYVQTFRKDSAVAIICSNKGSSTSLFGMCLADYTDSYSRTRLASVGSLLLKHRGTQFAANPCSFLYFTTKYSPRFKHALKGTISVKVTILCFFTPVTHTLGYS